ncbi:MAG: hypothetical protein ABEI86_11605 [Halobacteriaceae archaeon]
MDEQRVAVLFALVALLIGNGGVVVGINQTNPNAPTHLVTGDRYHTSRRFPIQVRVRISLRKTTLFPVQYVPKNAGRLQVPATIVANQMHLTSAPNTSIPTSITLIITQRSNETVLVSGFLMTTNGNPIANESLYILINGQRRKTVRTNASGYFDLVVVIPTRQIDFGQPKKNKITAIYNGSGTKFARTETSVVFAMNKGGSAQQQNGFLDYLQQFIVILWAHRIPVGIVGLVVLVGIGYLGVSGRTTTTADKSTKPSPSEETNPDTPAEALVHENRLSGRACPLFRPRGSLENTQ